MSFRMSVSCAWTHSTVEQVVSRGGTDPALTGVLKAQERSLRRALSYPVDGL
jgi:hypothetical protein